MNRLIIIGNGFDLAHKMKTSYSDFIFTYIKESFLIASKGVYQDHLFIIRKNPQIKIPNIENITTLDDFMQFLSPKKKSLFFYITEDDYSDKSGTLGFSWQIKNEFIEHIFTVCHKCQWVDIENEYYTELIKILGLKNEETKQTAIKELNSSFEFLKKQLENYLSILNVPAANQKYNKYFYEKIMKNEIVTETLEDDEHPQQTLILNFNYTSSIESYFEDQPEITINYIHGQLNKEDNPIIFGFGDEIDNDYKRLESDKIKGFLHYIKSFWYFKTSNYHNLIRFINSDHFQVQIFGHSCGLSDRTMLNMIFEHFNCKSIKIFYYKHGDNNNYIHLTEEISRHFHDKGTMRMKIVPFDKSSPMPQAD